MPVGGSLRQITFEQHHHNYTSCIKRIIAHRSHVS
jgi:hypothetical protein